jgi:hypothetical protein
MLKNLNLTVEEEEALEFYDEEEVFGSTKVEWDLLGKVLSLSVVHASAIQGAMKPAWGNPASLKIRSIGVKSDNLFVVEFNFKQDMKWALNGSPWVVGRYFVLLREYDEPLKPSEINFNSMDIWVRLLDLPLRWMNQHCSARVMGLIGAVKKVDVEKDGKASGLYLHALVGIEIAKPLRSGVLMKTKKDAAPE